MQVSSINRRNLKNSPVLALFKLILQFHTKAQREWADPLRDFARAEVKRLQRIPLCAMLACETPCLVLITQQLSSFLFLKHSYRTSHSLNHLSLILSLGTFPILVRFCSSMIHILSNLASLPMVRKKVAFTVSPPHTHIHCLAVFSRGQVSVLSAWDFSDENTNEKKFDFFVRWDGQRLQCHKQDTPHAGPCKMHEFYCTPESKL